MLRSYGEGEAPSESPVVAAAPAVLASVDELRWRTVEFLKEALAEPEKNLIHQALEANHWNRQETAKALQINRTTLYKKMKQYGLDAEAERLGLT